MRCASSNGRMSRHRHRCMPAQKTRRVQPIKTDDHPVVTYASEQRLPDENSNDDATGGSGDQRSARAGDKPGGDQSLHAEDQSMVAARPGHDEGMKISTSKGSYMHVGYLPKMGFIRGRHPRRWKGQYKMHAIIITREFLRIFSVLYYHCDKGSTYRTRVLYINFTGKFSGSLSCGSLKIQA